jgi:hypothetical protein
LLQACFHRQKDCELFDLPVNPNAHRQNLPVNKN